MSEEKTELRKAIDEFYAAFTKAKEYSDRASGVLEWVLAHKTPEEIERILDDRQASKDD